MTKEQLIEGFRVYMDTVLATPALAFADMTDPQVVWENHVPDHIPFGGRYDGIQALARYLTELVSAITMGPLEYFEFYAETETNTLIVVGRENDSVCKATGRTYSMPFVWVARFNEERRLIYCREHNDTCEMSEAFDK
jgi:ketosteroid isomerase-like protein